MINWAQFDPEIVKLEKSMKQNPGNVSTCLRKIRIYFSITSQTKIEDFKKTVKI